MVRRDIRTGLDAAENLPEIVKSKLTPTRFAYVPGNFTVAAGLSITPLSQLGATLGFNREYKKTSLQFRFAPAKNSQLLIDQLYSKQVIIYDEHTKIALLSNLIHLVVFLVRAHLKQNGYNGNQVFLDIPAKFPSGIIARRAELRELQSQEICTGFKFSELFQHLATKYSNMYSTIPMAQKDKAILGFALADLLLNEDKFYARQLPVKNGIDTWGALARELDVIFCSGICEMMALSDTGAPNIPKCVERPPKSQNILIAPIPLLRQVFHSTNNRQYRTDKGGVTWCPTRAPFGCRNRLGSAHCNGTTCWKSRMQKFENDVGRLQKRHNGVGWNDEEIKWIAGLGVVGIGRFD